MASPIWCGRTWFAYNELWPQPHPTPLGMNWNVHLEPGLISQHQYWTSLMLLWLMVSNPCSQVPKSRGKPETRWVEAVKPPVGFFTSACWMVDWLRKPPPPTAFLFDNICNFLKATIQHSHPPHRGVKDAEVWTSLFNSVFTLLTQLFLSPFMKTTKCNITNSSQRGLCALISLITGHFSLNPHVWPFRTGSNKSYHFAVHLSSRVPQIWKAS